MSTSADLLLINAQVLTLEPKQPRAEAVAVRGESIAAVGSYDQVVALRGPRTRTIDCQGMALLPGFVDAHCHMLSLAASLTAVNCGPEAVTSIDELRRVVQRRAADTPPGRWVRGFGYDELALAEGRHPTRWDLDQTAPHHPVRLDHRSGHATVLNSRALELAGIHQDTPDPVEGIIVRNENTGEPTGLLLELAGFLRQRLGFLRSEDEFDEGIARLDQMLLRYGITSVQEAGPDNDLARWETFRGLKASGRLACRVTMLAGASHLEKFGDAGLRCGDGDDGLRLGPAKVMLTLTTGALRPGLEELSAVVTEAQRRGFPVAIHAVEQEAVEAAALVLQEARQSLARSNPSVGRGWPRHRIEHCAECPPDLVARVQQCGAMVVTQPGFVYWNGDRYREQVEPSMLPFLYPIGALAGARVPLAFGSDAPVIDPNPVPAIYSAVTRYTRSGGTLPQEGCIRSEQRVSIESALRMYTLGGAFAEGSKARKGTIRKGKLADLVVLDANPVEVAPSRLKDLRVALTMLGGRVVWDGGLLSDEGR